MCCKNSTSRYTYEGKLNFPVHEDLGRSDSPSRVGGLETGGVGFHPGSSTTNCVTVRNVFNLAKLWFSHLQTGDNNNTCTPHEFSLGIKYGNAY